jgi:hypothetical protein
MDGEAIKIQHIYFLVLYRDSGLDVDSPKHGKIDPNNAPHVGQYLCSKLKDILWNRNL